MLSWPMTYVLDKAGRIAAKDLIGPELDAKVARLVDETK